MSAKKKTTNSTVKLGFKVGDVVQLQSGGVAMTVLEMNVRGGEPPPPQRRTAMDAIFESVRESCLRGPASSEAEGTSSTSPLGRGAVRLDHCGR